MIWYCKTDNIKIEYIDDKLKHPILYEAHCHTQFEMMAVIKGDIIVMSEGQSIRLKENQVIIIPPLFYHSVTANEHGDYLRITALFDRQIIPEALQKEFCEQARKTTIDPTRLKRIKEIIQGADQSFYAPLLQCLMIETFYDAFHSPSPYTEIEIDEFLQKTFRYIDEHLHEKILLDDLAKVTTRSKSSFCHIFEEKMKVSPKQYILKKKLAIASKLIDEGMPRTLAARHVGYQNYSDFYRLYSKQFKSTTAKKEKV